MALLFDVPDIKKVRVILDTDAACEADDPFAIAHALLSPKLIVKGIVAEHFNKEGSVERSLEEIKTILKAMDLESKIPYFLGEEGPYKEGSDVSVVSEGVDFIISEAKREDEHPLFVLCQGAITNVAAALRKDPSIASGMTVVWIGTHGKAPSTTPWREFNSGNDVLSANYVLESTAKLWLIPSNVYITVNVGIATLQKKVYPCGKIGRHLFEQLVAYNNSEEAGWTKGESWSLGDSPAVAVTLNPDCGTYEYVKAPYINDETVSVENPSGRMIRLYTSVDSNYILDDLFSKLSLCYPE